MGNRDLRTGCDIELQREDRLLGFLLSAFLGGSLLILFSLFGFAPAKVATNEEGVYTMIDLVQDLRKICSFALAAFVSWRYLGNRKIGQSADDFDESSALHVRVCFL